MAERGKHIDKAIRTKLKDYHEAAPVVVWEGVADHLAIERRKARVFWITRVAAAAVVVVMAGSAWLLMRNNEDRTLSQDERDTQEVISGQGETEGPEDELQQAERNQIAEQQSAEQQTGEQQTAELYADVQQTEEQLAEELQAGEQLAEELHTEELQAGEQLAEERHAEEQQAGEQRADRFLAEEQQAGILTEDRATAATDTDAEIALAGSDITNMEAMYIAALDPGVSPGKPGNILRENRTYPRVYQKEEDLSEGIVVIDETTDTEEASGRKWALGTQISPVYSYRDLGGSSSPGGLFSRTDASTAASNSTYNAVESGMMAYSGGVNLNYLPGDRLTVQSGLYYSRMGLAVDHAYLSPPYSQVDMDLAETLKYQTISNSTGTISMGGSPASPGSGPSYTSNWSTDREFLDYTNAPVSNQQNAQINSGQVEQQFEYLELPMIVKYKMVDRRIGFNVLGGMTTNFLIGSDAYYTENNRKLIGETIDIRKVNYSSLVGLGVDYKLSDRLQLNLEPFFKYYLNSINLSSFIKSRPYSVGVYTGISYLF